MRHLPQLNITTTSAGRAGGLEVSRTNNGINLRAKEVGFWAQIDLGTGTGSTFLGTGTGSNTAPTPYAWHEVQPLGNGTWLAVTGGRQGNIIDHTGTSPTLLNPAYEVNDLTVADGTIVWLWEGVQGEFLFALGGGGEDGQWVRLVDKVPGAGNNTPLYQWRGVKEQILEAITVPLTGTGTDITPLCGDLGAAALTWIYDGTEGNFHCNNNPAFEVNGVDLPVEFEGDGFGTADSPGTDGHWLDPFVSEAIVWLRKGQGNWSFFNQPPRWENVVKTGPAFYIDGVLYHPGLMLNYDQVTKQVCSKKSILIRSVKCITLDDAFCCVETPT